MSSTAATAGATGNTHLKKIYPIDTQNAPLCVVNCAKIGYNGINNKRKGEFSMNLFWNSALAEAAAPAEAPAAADEPAAETAAE